MVPNQINVRSHALRIATDLASVMVNNGARASDIEGNVKKMAAEFETFIWGKFKPQELPPTPLTTIKEAAEATRARLAELTENSADEELKSKLTTALGTWERFVSELESALGYLLHD